LVWGHLEVVVEKLIGYARVSTKQQGTDRQEVDLLAASVRRDNLYVDEGGAECSSFQAGV
jgi:DNA invertase Pin-like site-specific DNA recombinase